MNSDNHIEVGYQFAIDDIKEKIKKLRLKKRTNMTADYAWALEDIDNLIEEIERIKE